MTLIEIMVVLAIMGMGMAFFLSGSLLKSKSARLREAAIEVMVTLRAAHNLATMTGKHHRVVFDLDAQSYHIEVCSGAQTLRRGDEEEVVDGEALEKLRERMQNAASSDMRQQLVTAESPEEAVAAAAALLGLRIGTSRCQPAIATISGQRATKENRHKLDVERGMRISQVYVQHLSDPVDEKIVTINFFPLGSAEKAVVQLANGDGDEDGVILFGMTARIEFRSGEVNADQHMHRDGVGDEVED